MTGLLRDRRLLIPLKFAVSATLIALLLSRFEFSSFLALASELDGSAAVLALLLLVAQFPLSAWKWQIALKAHELRFGFGFLLRVLCIGFFFNNFLPTSIGGDAYRAFRTRGDDQGLVRPVSAVVLDRLLGIVALLVIGLVSTLVLLYGNGLEHASQMRVVAYAGLASLLAIVAAWYAGPVRRLRRRIVDMPKLRSIAQNLQIVARHPQELAMTLALSFVFQCLSVATISVLFLAVGAGTLFAQSGFVALASGVAGLLPISLNGIGVMEGSFAVAALEARIPYDQAVFVALSLRMFMLGSSVVCGVLYFLDPVRPRREAEAVR